MTTSLANPDSNEPTARQVSPQDLTSNGLTRRDFVGGGVTMGALLSASYASGIAAAPSKSPNEKLNIAHVGVQGRAWASVQGTASENQVAFCDVDSRNLDRATKMLESKYKKSAPKQYADYRVMLDKEEKNIDAVVVATADHNHAPPSAMAIRRGKHVYCEKPLTHTVEEARILAELSIKHKVATQMGTQIHASNNYRRVVEMIQSGAIGQVGEVYTWVTKGWADGRFGKPQPAPKNLNWDLWLGPAPKRPYSGGIHPAHWRKFWDYGGGTLGDMGCHIIDVVFWSLALRHPDAAWAQGPPVHPVGCPKGLQASWHFPKGEMDTAEGKKPRRDVTLHWSDNGNHPKVLHDTVVGGKPLARWGIGALFIGDKGKLACNYGGLHLLPADDFKAHQPPKQTIPASMGHHNEWIHACKTGDPTTCNFDYSGALTETVLLGNVAFRVGKKLAWDGKSLKATNAPEASQFVAKKYREGWDLVRGEGKLG